MGQTFTLKHFFLPDSAPSLCCHRHALPHRVLAYPFRSQTRFAPTHTRLTRLARSETARVQHSSARNPLKSRHHASANPSASHWDKDRSTSGPSHTHGRSGVEFHGTTHLDLPASPEYEQHVYKRTPARLVALFKHARSQRYTWRKDTQQENHSRDHRGTKSAVIKKKKTSKAADHAAAPLSYNASGSLPVGGQWRLG